MMSTTIETIIQTDGELHLSHLPVRKGDRIAAVISVVAPVATADAEQQREQAKQQFLALAHSSLFCSTDRYPTRDELHERD